VLVAPFSANDTSGEAMAFAMEDSWARPRLSQLENDFAGAEAGSE
jgi:hypothetical protein